MGVPRFFQHIIKVYPGCSQQLAFSAKFPVGIDGLYIDANGIIHNCVGSLCFEKKPSQVRMAPQFEDVPPKPPKPIPTSAEIYAKICDYIDQIVTFARPRQLLYVAIDGTAPLAKQAQQRQRRYRSAYEKTEEDFQRFDTCQITPGTEFLEGLGAFMHAYFKKKVGLKKASAWKGLKVVFSDSSVIGEGEHNCIDSIRANTDPAFVHCIYGLDADLFMLALASHRENMYLLREDMFTRDLNETYFYLCDIHKLRDLFVEKWGAGTTIRNRLVDDFVFVCYFVGNDFLHMAPAITDLHAALLLMLEIRQQTLGYDKYITDGGNLVIENLAKWMSEFARYEPGMLSKQYYADSLYPRVTLNNSLVDKMNPGLGVDLAKFRQNYYQKADILKKENVPTFCREYLEGLEWVNWYYHHTPLNWRWNYKHHHTPLLTDLAGYLTHFKEVTRVSQIVTPPNMPFQQLLCVVPPRSVAVLPKELRGAHTDPALVKYFPSTFTIDQEGKTQNWEGTVLLPFIDFNDILEFWNRSKTPALENHPRNKPGEIKEYK